MDNASNAIRKADLVYLACPPGVREPYVLEAARAGKALFLEKPFGVSIVDSERVLVKLKSYNIPVTVNFTQASGLALSDLLAAKKSGSLGSMQGVDIVVTYSDWPRQ